MNGRRRTGILVTMIALLALLLAACEMPSPSVGDVQTIPDDQAGEVVEEGAQVEETGVEEAYPAAEQEAAVEVESEEAEMAAGETEEMAEPEAASGEEMVEEVVEETAESPRPEDEQPAEEGEAAEAPAAEEEEAAAEEPAAVEETTAEAETAAAEPAEAATAELPEGGVHVVQPGETLYQIGLKYGYSWVVLAQHNNIFNADSIKAGQEIKIPPKPSEQPDPLPTPVPNATDETLYTVRAGDNLFLIGLIYGIDWPQIAEANGLVNPNHIIVGQTLKIPTDTPGDAPEFTHIVQRGETLFLIALRYGVTWPIIAEKNELQPPYVIYPDQTLIIPASK